MMRSERNVVFRIIGKLFTTILSLALIFLLGIAIASWVKGTTFTIEWANMVAWFATWAK